MTKKAPLAVILCNLGTPTAPTPKAVRAFLKPFLSDPRVVEVPRPIWLFILYAFILPFRPRPVAEGYQEMWDHYGDSPLRLTTKEQVEKLIVRLNQPVDSAKSNNKPGNQSCEAQVLVDYAFTYTTSAANGDPSIAEQVDRYRQQADKVVLLPLYPQYSCSTTAAIYDQLAQYNRRQRDIADVCVIKHYYAHAAYRKALAGSVAEFWQEQGRGDHLLISCHGVPKRYADLGDPYQHQCLQTGEHLVADLNLNAGDYSMSFQSRLGKAEWLKPYTDATVKALAQEGKKIVDVVCPSFSVDCLETLEEITIENGEYFTEAGGEKLRLIPCLNANDAHIDMMVAVLDTYLP